jgi:hypothetical protein
MGTALAVVCMAAGLGSIQSNVTTNANTGNPNKVPTSTTSRY